MFGYDEDDYDNGVGVGENVTTTKVLGQNMNTFSFGLADLVASPQNFASNPTYTIDAGKILNLMRLLDSHGDDTLSIVSETSELNNLDDIDAPFVDCSSNQVEEHVLRASNKKRRAPQPPSPQTTPPSQPVPPPQPELSITEDSLNVQCDDIKSVNSDIKQYGMSGDYLDVGETYRERSKSASSTSSTRSILKGFSFFRVKNAAK